MGPSPEVDEAIVSCARQQPGHAGMPRHADTVTATADGRPQMDNEREGSEC